MTYIVKAITKFELAIVMLEWAKKLDWKYSKNDVDAYFAINGMNMYSLKIFNDCTNEYELIGCISISSYNSTSSIGLFVIKEEYRGKNHGQQLLDYALKQLNSFKIISLNSVPKVANYYLRNGFFRTGTVNSHFSLGSKIVKESSDKELSDNLNFANPSSINLIIGYEQELFNDITERKKFLNVWLARPDAVVVIYSCNHKIEGYGVLTICNNTATTKSYRISPMIADSIEVAASLFYKLFSYIKNSDFDVIELNALSSINSHLIVLLNSLGFNKIDDGDTELMITQQSNTSKKNINPSLFKVIAMNPLEFPHEELQLSTKIPTL